MKKEQADDLADQCMLTGSTCARQSSDMSPCVIKDGAMAVGQGITFDCVGCGRQVKSIAADLGIETEKEPKPW